MNSIDAERLICDTLLDMMEEKSCFNIKVTDLVKRASISRSSFYTHFDSILDVVDRIESDYLAGLPDVGTTVSTLSPTFEQGQESIAMQAVDASWQYIYDNMRTYRLLTGQNGEPLFHRRFEVRNRRIGVNLFREYAPGAPADELEATACYFAGSRMAIYDWWAFHADEIDAAQIQALVSDLYWKTLDVAIRELQRKYGAK